MKSKFEVHFALYVTRKYGGHVDSVGNIWMFISAKDIIWSDLPESMRWSILMDFFREEGNIIIDIQPVMDYNNKFYTKVDFFITNVIRLKDETEYDLPDCQKIEEARKEAIKISKQLYNGK